MARAADKLSETIKIRLSRRELRKAEWCAREYAEGNFSSWVRWALKNAPRKYLKNKD